MAHAAGWGEGVAPLEPQKFFSGFGEEEGKGNGVEKREERKRNIGKGDGKGGEMERRSKGKLFGHRHFFLCNLRGDY